jgi:ketosteroid isomerase-like protein
MEIAMPNEVSELQVVGEKFLQALANRDFDALQACFQPDMSFRALVPPGVRQATDTWGGAKYLRRRFGDADSFEVLRTEIGHVTDRLPITYRIRLHDPDGWK